MNTETAFPAAGFGRRLGGIFYDSILLLCVLLVASVLATLVLKLTTGQGDYKALSAVPLFFFRLYFVLAGGGFLAWFWVHGGQTLGMRAWRIRVVDTSDQPIRWSQALARVFFILLTPGIGLLWAIVDRQRRALYDRLSKTRLVLVEKAHVPPLHR